MSVLLQSQKKTILATLICQKLLAVEFFIIKTRMHGFCSEKKMNRGNVI